MNNEEKILELLEKHGEMLAQMQGDLAGVKGQLSKVEDLATRTALTQENVIQPAIDALVEGQELTHQMLKELATKGEIEDLRDQLQILRTVVAAHSREIEALKKAQ